MDMKPTFSLCATNYNNVANIERSLDSMLDHLDGDDVEIIVVDSKSTDGSLEVLENYSKTKKHINIISWKCSRGMGWQRGFDNSRGSIIVIVALDTIYNHKWGQAVRMFHSENFDFALHMWYSEIYPRELLTQIGGWNDLQYMEDLEIRARLAGIGKLRRYPMICGEDLKGSPSTSFLEKTSRRYRKMHDAMLLKTHIPFNLWLAATLRKLKQSNERKITAFGKYLYYLPLMVMAKSISRVRRQFGDFGDVRNLAKKEDIFIDLGLGVTDEDHDKEHLYDTTEQCWQAYRSGDTDFIPLLYD